MHHYSKCRKCHNDDVTWLSSCRVTAQCSHVLWFVSSILLSELHLVAHHIMPPHVEHNVYQIIGLFFVNLR